MNFLPSWIIQTKNFGKEEQDVMMGGRGGTALLRVSETEQ